VAGCCDPIAYRRLFSRKSAARDLRRYREHGLNGTSRELVALAGDVQGVSVLDVGGGIGADRTRAPRSRRGARNEHRALRRV